MSTQAAELFDEMFKFKIGDVVRLIGADVGAGAARRYMDSENPTRFIITGLELERCHGGFQQHYHCYPVSPGGNTRTPAMRMIEPLFELAGRWETEDPKEKKA